MGYEVFAGNRSDVTTVEQIVQTMEGRGFVEGVYAVDGCGGRVSHPQERSAYSSYLAPASRPCGNTYSGLLFGIRVVENAGVQVQRESDKFRLRLREYLAFGKEVFLGMREFWIANSRECAGRPI